MKRVGSAIAAMSLLFASAAPAAAADFPEQPNLDHACDVVQSLPKDIIGHLLGVSPVAADILIANLTDACNL
jgi:hypothetical protein